MLQNDPLWVSNTWGTPLCSRQKHTVVSTLWGSTKSDQRKGNSDFFVDEYMWIYVNEPNPASIIQSLFF